MHQRRKAYTGTGVMVAFYVPPRSAALLSRLARRTLGTAAEPAEDLHLTLAYLGKTDAPALDKATVLAALTSFVQAHRPPARLDVAGAKTFDTVQDDGTIPVYAAVAKTPELLDFRAALVAALEGAGVAVSKDFATYTPHITLGYVAPDVPATLPRVPRLALAAGPVWLGWGGELIPIVPEGVTTKPMRSQAQWKYLFANGMPFARRWAHETPGGKGTRFRKLPRKKKVAATEKAPNYSARAGQVITGNLARGGDGKFTSAGAASATPSKPKKAPKRRPARTPKKPKLSAEQRQAQRQAERDALRRANEAKVGQDGGLGEDLNDALLEFASPDEAITLAPQNKAELERRGLVETGPDGAPRISQAGRAYVNAARTGDVSRARDALSRASERRQRADERASAAQQRQQERAARRAELEQRRAARAAKPKKGGGGKGGGKGKQPKGGDTATVARQLEEGFGRIAQLLRAGKAADVPASRFAVFKDAKGQWRWITLTSVGYEDRDREIVSTKALAADVARADTDGKYGPLRWWHMGEPDPASADAPWGPGLDLGWCDFNAMSDQCLIESGTFTSPVIAEGLAAKADTLGVSPGFFHPPDEPTPDSTFTSIRRFERSLAPHSVVANPFTRFSAHKEHRMDQEKLKALATLVGLSEDDVRQHVTGMTATAHKAAAEAGVRFKTADEPPQPGQRFKAGDGTEYIKSPSPLDPLGAHYAVKAPDMPETEKAPPAAAMDAAADMAEDAADMAADEAEEESFLTEGDLDRIATRVADKLMAALSTITGKVGELDEQMKQYGYARTKTAEEAAQQQQQLEATIAQLTQQQAQSAAALKTAQEQLAQLRGEQPGQQPHVASTSSETALRPDVAAAIKTLDDSSTQEVQPKAAQTLAWIDAVVSGRPPQQQPPAI